MLTRAQIGSEEPGLLALMDICGVEFPRAAQELRNYLAHLDAGHLRERPLTRVVLYSGVLNELRPALCRWRQDAARNPHSVTRGRTTDSFSRTSWDLQAALLLMTSLDFSLRESAVILQTDAGALACRLDFVLDALDRLDARS